MPKFPDPPAAEALSAIAPVIKVLAAATPLARVYFTGGEYPTRWNAFRRFGPTNARFDHHLVNTEGQAWAQERAVMYCAPAAPTCFAEVFQETRAIHRTRRSPWLAVFALEREVQLLDLTGTFPTRVGASMAINTGQRARARRWAAAFYEAYPKLSGLYYPSSMHGNAAAIALTDRAERATCMPPFPRFNRALADDVLLDVLKHTARDLGYGLL